MTEVQLMDLVEQSMRRRDHQPRGRYAPSPTGPLHLGNLRTALLAWLHMRLLDGVFVLRMEDLDLPRVKKGSAESILRDLGWMGLDWDEGPDKDGPFNSYTQSQRFPIYHAVLARLQQAGRVYACMCSRKDVAEAASAPHGNTPVYPGTCRSRGDVEVMARQLGRNPSFRLNVQESGQIDVDDEVAGHWTCHPAEEMGDFVVLRADGLHSYQLAVAVDDCLMNITHVVRGSDLRSSTPKQMLIMQTLGFDPPRYLHVPLMLDHDGRRMSKRDGSQSLANLRSQGVKAETIIANLAASCGLIEPACDAISSVELLQELNLEKFTQILFKRQQGSESQQRSD